MEQRILDLVSRSSYKPLTPAGLARKLKVSKSQASVYRKTLAQLIESGKLVETRNGRIRPRSAPGLIAGIVKRTSHGTGYLIPHEDVPGVQGDLYLRHNDIRDAHTGDEVLVRLLKRRGRGGRRCGRVEEVLVRATSTFVGTYFEESGQGYVQVDGTVLHEPVLVGDPGAKGARPDDKVVIDMLRFPSLYQPGEAVLIRVLGPRGEPGVDTLSIVHEFGLPLDFPQAVLDEAHQQADAFDEDDLQGRIDLTKETIVTIDPADARDFDDAISLSRSKDGHWHLGVHIADVSAFVLPGSPLDDEARKRGNSAYLPDMVIPMLPEVLSNGLASLQKGKVRYTKSALIEFTPDGIPVQTDLVNSVIKVTRRFAYEDVMPIVEEPDRFRSRVSAKVRVLLAQMHELAMLLRQRRRAAGALEMDLPEVKLEFDKQGRVTGAREAEHDESHQIIEEFMLAANTAVATTLDDRDVPFIRRTHGDPDPIKLKAFAEFVNALGYPLKRYQSRTHLQALIDRVRGKSTEHAVNYALLRSMKPAEYTGIEMGHYALAVENYCHFTSPIRRYPDLVVHRLIDDVLISRRRRRPKNETELTKLGKHCSETERRAEKAERELTKVKLLTYMEERIGDELDAVITGVDRFGFFCQGVKLPVEGLVHISALDPGDFFDYEASTFSLTGRRTGTRYRLGDTVRVRVAHVDVDRRQLDFQIVATKSGRKKKSASPSRPAHKSKAKRKDGKKSGKRTRRRRK